MTTPSSNVRTLSLGQVVLVLAVVCLLIASGVSATLVRQIREKAITDLAREEAHQVAEMAFLTLYSAMQKGWTRDDITRITEQLNSVMPGVRIQVFRGAPVIAQFGDIAEERKIRQSDSQLQNVLATGQEHLSLEDTSIRYLFPVKVRNECLGCHTSASLNDINGVIDISYAVNNLKISLSFALNVVSLIFLLMILAVVALFYLFQKRFVTNPIQDLVQAISEIIENMDLRRRVKPLSRITEIARLKSHFNTLIGTVEEYQEQLITVSTRDALTGLINRSKFHQTIGFEIRRHSLRDAPFSLLLVDADHFQHINDAYGPAVGDVVLKQLAEGVAEWTENDAITARIGGDSFAVLLPDTMAENALRQAVKLREHLIASHLGLENEPVRIMCSIGVASYPKDGTTADELLAALELAVSKAKRARTLRVASIVADDHRSVVETVTNRDQIIEALEENRIIPEFEPIMGIDGQDIFAYEALARICDGGKLLKAYKFIEVAEQFGLAESVDMRIIECGLAAKSRGLLGSAKLFFNLSTKTLANHESINTIVELVALYNTDPSEVVFEITEREALPKLAQFAQLTRELNEKGFSFALDDFGSGFSSFMYLKYLAIDFVKIEGSFVSDMLNNEQDYILVRNIGRVISEFGLSAIAEYVENSETAAALAKMGVQYAQGYLYKHRAINECESVANQEAPSATGRYKLVV